jgi:hypothetical protein
MRGDHRRGVVHRRVYRVHKRHGRQIVGFFHLAVTIRCIMVLRFSWSCTSLAG